MARHTRSRNRLRALLFLPAFALACAVHAQPATPTSTPTRIGYVDMKRLLDNAPQVVTGRQKLEHEFAARDAELKIDEKRLADLRARQTGAAAPPKTDAESLQREIDALDRSIKRNRDAMRADLKARSDQELDRSWREINDAVVEFAREQGYDLIVPSPVVYASPKVDITEQILDRLRRQPAKAASP